MAILAINLLSQDKKEGLTEELTFESKYVVVGKSQEIILGKIPAVVGNIQGQVFLAGARVDC